MGGGPSERPNGAARLAGLNGFCTLRCHHIQEKWLGAKEPIGGADRT